MSWNITEMEVIWWSEARGIIQNSDSKTQLLASIRALGDDDD